MTWTFYDASGRQLVLGVGGTGVLHADLLDVTPGQHHAQSHVLTGVDHVASGLTAGHVLTALSGAAFGWAAPVVPVQTHALTIIVDGGASAITTGVKGSAKVPFPCTMTGWEIVSVDGTSGSIVVELWVDSYANYPPTGADLILGTEKPTLSGQAKNTDTSLNGGAGVAIADGSWILWNVVSALTVTRVALSLMMVRS